MVSIATAAEHRNEIDVVCCTYHFNRDANYNEKNLGLKYSRHLTSDLLIDVAYYNNSEGGYSRVFGISHAFPLTKDWEIRLGMGIVTGYKRGNKPYIMPSISYKRVNFIIIPHPTEGGINLSIRALEW